MFNYGITKTILKRGSFIGWKELKWMISELQLRQLMDTYSEDLLRIAYFYTRQRHVAEEIVQDVFVKFYYLKTYDERGELLAFLKRMTINASKDYLKSWHYRKMIVKEKLHITAPEAIASNYERQYEEQQIEHAILQLPIKLREPIVYFYFENMKIRDIAVLLDLSENTVKTRMRTAKKKLYEQLHEVQWEVLLHGEA